MARGLGDMPKDSTENANTTDESNSSTSGDEDQPVTLQEDSNHAQKRHCPFPDMEMPGPSKKPCPSTSGDEDQPVTLNEESNHAQRGHCPSSDMDIPGPGTSGDEDQPVTLNEESNHAQRGHCPSSDMDIPGPGTSGDEDQHVSLNEESNHAQRRYCPSLDMEIPGPRIASGDDSSADGVAGVPSVVEGHMHASPEVPGPIANHYDYNVGDLLGNRIINELFGGQTNEDHENDAFELDGDLMIPLDLILEPQEDEQDFEALIYENEDPEPEFYNEFNFN